MNDINRILTIITNSVSSQKKTYQNVIFDLGANIGDSALFFADPNFQCENCHELKGICTKDNKKWIMHSFEANPRYNDILDNVTKTVKKYGHTHYLYKQSAAWTKNEKLVFYLDTVNKDYDFWGSSLIKDHPDVISSDYKKVTINGIDISEILKKYNSDDEIVMKIDIEGAEYDLLLHLIKEGSLNLVDIIAVEYHPKIVKDSIKNFEILNNFFNQSFDFFNVKFIPWW
jgi:FkbM family methyltransferase